MNDPFIAFGGHAIIIGKVDFWRGSQQIIFWEVPTFVVLYRLGQNVV